MFAQAEQEGFDFEDVETDDGVLVVMVRHPKFHIYILCASNFYTIATIYPFDCLYQITPVTDTGDCTILF